MELVTFGTACGIHLSGAGEATARKLGRGDDRTCTSERRDLRGTTWEQRYGAPEFCLQAAMPEAERLASEVEQQEPWLDELLADIAVSGSADAAVVYRVDSAPLRTREKMHHRRQRPYV